ncbi:hypothetical protein EG028_15365 [Chitinophaga barathri]|uniref:Uncharacterized protein n=1 Tax=Chitinophaga barathri TaxID=1647451 RepID=A0A3N4MEI8_9BACT|nr:hypothetical protein EG028_15365 [Chitinophaga barathri]
MPQFNGNDLARLQWKGRKVYNPPGRRERKDAGASGAFTVIFFQVEAPFAERIAGSAGRKHAY